MSRKSGEIRRLPAARRRLTRRMIRWTHQVLISSCRAAGAGVMPWRATIVQTCRAYSENGASWRDLPQRLAVHGVPSSIRSGYRQATPYARPYPEAASGSPQTGAGGPLSDCPSAAHEIEQRLNRSQAACGAQRLFHSTQCFFERLVLHANDRRMCPGAPNPLPERPRRRHA